MATSGFLKTQKLMEVVGLINLVDAEKFELLLDRIITGLQSEKSNLFTDKELNQLESILNRSPYELHTIIQGCSFLFEQAAVKRLGNRFRDSLEELGIGEDKCEAFNNIWEESGAEFLNHLKEKEVIVANRLDTYDWKIDIPLGSNTGASLGPQAKLKLKLADGTDGEFVFDKQDLHQFFMNLEVIQNQLDNLTT